VVWLKVVIKGRNLANMPGIQKREWKIERLQECVPKFNVSKENKDWLIHSFARQIIKAILNAE
jgi:hypothetical protein